MENIGWGIALVRIGIHMTRSGGLFQRRNADICPVGPPTAILDEEDAFLMDSVITQATTAAAGSSSVVIPPGGHVVVGVERKKLDVSWLRRTEYLSSEGGKMMPGANTCALSAQSVVCIVTETLCYCSAPIRSKEVVAVAPETRGDAVEMSFAGPLGPLSELRHPTKSHLTAARAFDVLPDAELWANESALVRFGEDPGEGKAGDVRYFTPWRTA